ncbi:MAG: hypothetical protein EAZ89_15105, partial [Bacteroidetes bacterium]
MKEPLIRYIEQFVTLQPDEWNLLWQRIEIRRFAKDEVLHPLGKVCNEIFFIRKGVVRHLHRFEGKEGIAWFTVEGELATDIHSFLSREPGVQSLIASTDTEGFSLSYGHLQEL